MPRMPKFCPRTTVEIPQEIKTEKKIQIQIVYLNCCTRAGIGHSGQSPPSVPNQYPTRPINGYDIRIDCCWSAVSGAGSDGDARVFNALDAVSLERVVEGRRLGVVGECGRAFSPRVEDRDHVAGVPVGGLVRAGALTQCSALVERGDAVGLVGDVPRYRSAQRDYRSLCNFIDIRFHMSSVRMCHEIRLL